RLLLGLNFRKSGALADNIVAHLRELCFEIGRRCQSVERFLRVSFSRRCFIATHIEASARLRERRKSRRVAIEIALARGGSGSRAAATIEGRLCRFERPAGCVDFVARAIKFAVDRREPAALREAPGGAGRGVRRRDESTPAP